MDRLITFCLTSIALLSLSSGEIYNTVRKQDFDSTVASKEIVVISFIQSKSYDKVFQTNFKEAGNYLKDFGVQFGTVDCLSDSVVEYCSKSDAADNVYVFRHGQFLVTLAYDTLFGVDSIVSNILHLVLLVEVPIISDRADLEAKQRGKRDVLVGYIPAVGLQADRAFMEVAFAYKHKYSFVATTNRELLGLHEERSEHASGSSDPSQLPRPQVLILQCSMTGPSEPCPRSQFHGPITTESLALMMKTLELPPMVDLTTSGHTNVFMDHGVSAVYAIAGPAHHEEAIAVVTEIMSEFRGNLGFVIIDLDDVVLVDVELLPSSGSQCAPACFVFRGHEEDMVSNDIKDASDLRAFIRGNMPLVFSHLGNPSLEDEEREEDDHLMDWRKEEEESRHGDELPKQEQQDDLVQEATVHLRQATKAKDSPIPSLTDKTFPQFTHRPELTGILFTMKWNPRSLAFLESFESAAQSLIALFSKDKTSDSPLAQVECSDWPDVCDKSNVTVYPTVKMYRGEMDVATYQGILDENSFLHSYLLYDLPSPVEIASVEDMEAFTQGSFPAPWIRSHVTSVTLAVIPDAFTSAKAVLKQVAEELKGRHLLGLCSSACLNHIQGSNKNHAFVEVYKWNDPNEPRRKYERDFTIENLHAFISDASLPVLPELTAANMPAYLARGKPFVILFHAGDSISDKAATSLREIGGDNIRNQFVLCQMDSSQEGLVGSQTLVSYGFLPVPLQSTVVILDHGAGEVCRYPEGKDSSLASLSQWLQSFHHGSRECSETRALIGRKWEPLVPPYDYLKLMEDIDEDHLQISGRRGLRTHQELVGSSSRGQEGIGTETQRDKNQGKSDSMAHDGGKKAEVRMQQHKQTQHVEL